MVVKVISIYLFAGVMLLSFLFVNSFSKGKSSYAKMFGTLSFTLQIYLLGYLLELNSYTLEQMLFWNQIQYFGIPFFPAVWLAVSMLYTGRAKYLQGFHWLLVFAIPFTTFAVRMTNNWHHLYYSRIELHQFGEMTYMLLTKGPWYLVQTVYVLVALVLCTWFYYQRYRKSIGDEKMQFKLLFTASTLPYIALILVTVNLGGIGIDYTALILPFCVFFIILALTRYNFLEIKVLAREKVFEDSAVGLVLINRSWRVVDFNEASTRFFYWFHAEIKEEQLDILLKDQQALWEIIKHSDSQAIHLTVEGEDRYIYVDVREIQNNGEKAGSLITFEDVTERELFRRRLVERASTDELSGLNNRRRFREYGEECFKQAQHNHKPISVLMMDIDNFKRVNDSLGHSVGDAVIRDFSETLASSFRETCVAGRMGGEEFAVILPGTSAAKACKSAEHFRQILKEKDMVFGQHLVNITVSIGVAQSNKEILSFDSLINRADKALYEAKQAGRNCTVIAKQ